jgi:hypothetical protein
MVLKNELAGLKVSVDILQVEINKKKRKQRFYQEKMGIAWLILTALIMLPEVLSTRYIVGGNKGWSATVNYTIWVQDKNFFNGDWLFFVYDRNQMSVLEVNRTDYDKCNSDNPIRDWSTGAGRDVIPLNVTRPYYFISGNGFCYSDMKVAIHVENLPLPPSSSPMINPEILPPPSSPPPMNSHFYGHITPSSSPVNSQFSPSLPPSSSSLRFTFPNQITLIPVLCLCIWSFLF